MKDIDVLCIGITSYDLVFSVAQHPRADEKTTARALISCGGGPAANAAMTVAKLGLKAAFCGYLGNDIFGNLHFAELQSAKVNTDLIVRGKVQAPVSTVLVKPNGDRSLVNYRSSAPLKRTQVNIPDEMPRVILFDGHEPEISLSFLDYAKKNKIPTVLDAGSLNKGTAVLYDKVDYLVCSEIFARELCRTEDPEQALQKLYEQSRNIVLTLGEKGLLWKRQQGQGHLKAFPVTAVDTTGAGDIFHGAFASCLAWGKNWEYSLRFSSAAAAICCTKLGARTSIPGLVEVETFLRDQEI